MGYRLCASKPSRYVTGQLGQLSAFHPSGVGKSATGMRLVLRWDEDPQMIRKKINVYAMFTFYADIRLHFNVHTEQKSTFAITNAELQNFLRFGSGRVLPKTRGLGWVCFILGWVGLGQDIWTHVYI